MRRLSRLRLPQDGRKIAGCGHEHSVLRIFQRGRHESALGVRDHDLRGCESGVGLEPCVRERTDEHAEGVAVDEVDGAGEALVRPSLPRGGENLG